MGRVQSIAAISSLILASAVASWSACSPSTPTSVLLTVRAASPLDADKLLLDVYSDAQRVVSQRRLPKTGRPSLPASVVIYAKTETGDLRLVIRAIGTSNAFLGEGIARVSLQPGKQVAADITLQSSHFPDRDGDGVPDDLDRCPDLPNPLQGPCLPDAGPSENGGDTIEPHDGTEDGHPGDLGDAQPGDLSDAQRDTLPDGPIDASTPDLSPCSNLTCPLGCNVAKNRCYRVAPQGTTIAPKDYDLATGKIEFLPLPNVTFTLDTDTGEVALGPINSRPPNHPGEYDGVVWRPGATVADPSVFILDRLTIPKGVTVKVQGKHPLLIYVRHDAQIDGHIKLSATARHAGPGGGDGGLQDGDDGATCNGGNGRGGKTKRQILLLSAESGGGGGSLSAPGGDGGDAHLLLPAPLLVSGGQGGNHSVPTDLTGGCGGGGGGGPDTRGSPDGHGGFGGGGGGALQLTVNGTLNLSGILSAHGAGGDGGSAGTGGGGGGSGGMVILEAITLTMQPGALVAANGGGGGGAGTKKTATTPPIVDDGDPGQDGQDNTSPANGGQGTNFGGHGGDGGALQGSAEPGQESTKLGGNGGGGGGSAGYIVVRTRQGSVSGQASPGAVASNVVLKW
ncbi:MAG: thrombospondin type 3 repeat-containing protein [Deltaproteobacteria bacterium]|nr:thrombospondin type 3 repeat-containing protein [Deltaproteobacteria bacterium]